MENTLWKQDSFINNNIPFLFNKDIIEYDMKDAGFSLTKEFHLLDDASISRLEKLKKDRRKIEMGLIERDNDIYKEAKKTSFQTARHLFFDANELDQTNIISIKKDAIITTQKCNVQQIGDYILFRPKNRYTSYIQLGKRLEFYYSPSRLDVKGINDEMLALHEDYMIKFIKLFFHKMETENPVTVIEFVKRFITKYKRRELEVGYYRTFDFRSIFIVPDEDMSYSEYWEEEKNSLDISYNFTNILLKFIQIPL